jgi:hypothetical protein
MNKPHVCMFCRYRKTRAQDLEACCAGAEVLRAKTDTADQAPQGLARGVPERLRHPAPNPYQLPR